jgi:predicted ester cyclase/outer membrane murein-binding lipoprotein Lpp
MKKIYSILIVTSLLLVVGLLVGCSGVKKADYDAATAQVNTLQNQVNSLQTQLNAANTAKSQADANKALVRSYVEQVINAHNPNALDGFASPNYKRYPSATATINLDAAKQRLAGLFAAFPDAHVTIDDMIAEGDLVMYSDTIRCTHQGTFQGIAPTGKQVTVAEFITMRIENGKIAEHWGGPDTFSLLQQIGAVISPGQ